MRHNSCTVIVLASPAPPEVLATVGRSMNVTLVRPADPDGAADTDGLTAAAGALRRASSATSAYALVTADPLAAVAGGWQDMWDLVHPQGPARFEQEAATALAAWRAGQFELPDYYLVAASGHEPGHEPGQPGQTDQAGETGQDFYLGPLRAARPHRVVFVPAAEPAEQAAGVLTALGSLDHGPWWPSLDDLLQAARTFYPGRLSETTTPAAVPPVARPFPEPFPSGQS
jgi:hypothetical protein